MREEYSNLRKSSEYNFSCNTAEIGERFQIDTSYMDEWGCAIVWYGNKGIELNISYDSGMNQSAFYKLDVNPEDSDDITINTSYLCPMEIDWDAENWIEQLEDEACRALLEIFPELKQIQDTELKHYIIMYPEGNVFSGGYTSKQAAEEMKLTYHHMGALSSHAKIIEVPYEHITSSMLKRMRDEYGKTGKCTSNLGNFFIQEDDKFLAIANETGDLFIEEFETMLECFVYLSDEELYKNDLSKSITYNGVVVPRDVWNIVKDACPYVSERTLSSVGGRIHYLDEICENLDNFDFAVIPLEFRDCKTWDEIRHKAIDIILGSNNYEEMNPMETKSEDIKTWEITRTMSINSSNPSVAKRQFTGTQSEFEKELARAKEKAELDNESSYMSVSISAKEIDLKEDRGIKIEEGMKFIFHPEWLINGITFEIMEVKSENGQMIATVKESYYNEVYDEDVTTTKEYPVEKDYEGNEIIKIGKDNQPRFHLSAEYAYKEEEYIRSSSNRDYGPSNPWDAPGMSVSDFIGGIRR